MSFDFSQCTGFDWDAGNIAKSESQHVVNCREAEEVFFNQPLVVAPDFEHSTVESRYRTLGRTDAGRLLHLSFTLRDTKLRIISARPMNRKERAVYETHLR